MYCINFANAVLPTSFSGGGILFTKVVTNFDTGACVIVASILSGTACACGSLARDIGTVIALVGVISGLFTSVYIIAAYTIVNWTFVGNRKFALGILTFGSTIGQTIYPYIANALIELYSWEGCLLILSAIAFLNGIPCGLVIYYSKPYFQKTSDSHTTSGTNSYRSYLTDSAFMIWILASLLFTLLGPVEQWFIVDVAVLKGFGVQSGATLLSVNGIFGFIGRIYTTIILRFYPNTRPELHTCYAFMLYAASHASVVASPVYWAVFLAMIVRGLSSSIIIAFAPALQLELRGPQQFTRTVAISNMVMGIANIAGGYLGGYSVDATGSYNLIFYIATVGMVFGAISDIIIYAIFEMRKRQKSRYQSL